MPTNVFFDTGTKNEQDLYEAIAIEQIKIQGQEVFYLPRKLVAEDNLFTEDRLSTFNDAYLIEMVFNETEGFGGEKELMGKFRGRAPLPIRNTGRPMADVSATRRCLNRSVIVIWGLLRCCE